MVESPGKKCGNPLSDLLLLYHIFFFCAMADFIFLFIYPVPKCMISREMLRHAQQNSRSAIAHIDTSLLLCTSFPILPGPYFTFLLKNM